MKVKRVNYKDKMVIDYRTDNDFQRLYCSDHPEKEFVLAMAKCKQVLIDHMELKEIPEIRITIHGFELKKEAGDEKEYILEGMLKSTDGKSKTVLKTQVLKRPRQGDKFLETWGKKVPLYYVTEAEAKLIDDVLAEAAKYVAGNRSKEQPLLDFDDPKEELKKDVKELHEESKQEKSTPKTGTKGRKKNSG